MTEAVALAPERADASPAAPAIGSNNWPRAGSWPSPPRRRALQTA